MRLVAGPRVHFINRFFYPDTSATSMMLQGIAFGLASRGHNVHVVTSRQLYDDPTASLPASEQIRGVTVHRVAGSRFGRNRLLGRAIDYATFYIAVAVHLLRVGPGDVLVAKTDPPLVSLVAGAVAWIRGARLVNWLQDVFPEVAIAHGIGGRWTRAPFALLRRARNWTLRNAIGNVAIGERMAAHLVAEGAPAARVHLIANWADRDIVHPVPKNSLRDEWALSDKFVVGYSGNLGRVHELATLVDAIEAIARRSGDELSRRVAFVFVGGCAMRRTLDAEIAARGLRNVHLFPYQPESRLAETLAVPDVHLVTLRPEQEGFVVPSKIYGVMAAARPTIFIGDEDGEVARLVRRHDMGDVVAIGDASALTAAILALAADPEACQRRGRAARDAFEAAYTKEVAVDRWENLITSLSAASDPAGKLSPARTPSLEHSA